MKRIMTTGLWVLCLMTTGPHASTGPNLHDIFAANLPLENQINNDLVRHHHVFTDDATCTLNVAGYGNFYSEGFRYVHFGVSLSHKDFRNWAGVQFGILDYWPSHKNFVVFANENFVTIKQLSWGAIKLYYDQATLKFNNVEFHATDTDNTYSCNNFQKRWEHSLP